MSHSKIALVTGASRGIGAAISTRLAHDGFTVLVNYVNDEAAANAVVHQIKAAGGSAMSIRADISDAGAVQTMFDTAEKIFGGIDVLVNSAGVMKLSTLAMSDDALINSQIDINFKGSVNTMRAAANRLRNGGRIINLSTSVIGLKLETYSVYAATKAAIETMTAILSKELRGRSITVNAVAPGPTATDLFLNGKSDELIEKMSKMNPLERLGTPEDISHVVAFLASEQGGWVNGQTLRANGGMV